MKILVGFFALIFVSWGFFAGIIFSALVKGWQEGCDYFHKVLELD